MATSATLDPKDPPLSDDFRVSTPDGHWVDDDPGDAEVGPRPSLRFCFCVDGSHDSEKAYAARVAALEAEGITTSDAQGIASVEFGEYEAGPRCGVVHQDLGRCVLRRHDASSPESPHRYSAGVR